MISVNFMSHAHAAYKTIHFITQQTLSSPFLLGNVINTDFIKTSIFHIELLNSPDSGQRSPRCTEGGEEIAGGEGGAGFYVHQTGRDVQRLEGHRHISAHRGHSGSSETKGVAYLVVLAIERK